ncbi:uncharacterized protein RHIMIDRAFT_238332 [Rhizopus microsporus ATCC 52813]|uniref:Uncharacterized protein n=1 Tax=Rhizopus microsporus ATCC 52813 TaxID=1340429 RepID=A0A2G4SSD5_RHIZD|nr:uncharacterized protein RHIMIDRAFT_238332 [Rhizopus microsporus ATCC 52813]PHZ11662.1 hypothetical protein RHIMIDRAFT_238332 [Rhizopus microsporus ATCC 52813]
MANDDNTDQAYEHREDFIIIHGYEIVKDIPYDMYGSCIKQIDLSTCVGYFKFRRQTDVELSVRDQLWMKSFSEYIKHGCMAIISSSLLDKATHTYEFAFWDMRNYAAKLPLEIANMCGSTLEFRRFMSNVPFVYSASNDLLAPALSPELVLNHYNTIYSESMRALKTSTNKVIQKEKELQELKKEIEELKQQAR